MHPSRAPPVRWLRGSSRRSAGSTARSTRGEPTAIRPAGAPPEDVTLYALDQQRIHILLSARPRLARAVLADLPGRIAAHARASIRARRMLGRLSTPQSPTSFKTGPAQPAGRLLGYYREAQKRFGVSWRVLAAVNLVESALRPDAQPQHGRRPGADAVHPRHLGRLRHGREHPRSAGRGPRRRQLPPRQRRPARLPRRALSLQPELALRGRGARVRGPHPPRLPQLLLLLRLAGVRPDAERHPSHHRARQP